MRPCAQPARPPLCGLRTRPPFPALPGVTCTLPIRWSWASAGKTGPSSWPRLEKIVLRSCKPLLPWLLTRPPPCWSASVSGVTAGMHTLTLTLQLEAEEPSAGCGSRPSRSLPLWCGRPRACRAARRRSWPRPPPPGTSSGPGRTHRTPGSTCSERACAGSRNSLPCSPCMLSALHPAFGRYPWGERPVPRSRWVDRRGAPPLAWPPRAGLGRPVGGCGGPR